MAAPRLPILWILALIILGWVTGCGLGLALAPAVGWLGVAALGGGILLVSGLIAWRAPHRRSPQGALFFFHMLGIAAFLLGFGMWFSGHSPVAA